MAEAALFTIASKVLSKIASLAFKKAYERVESIRGATDELEELEKTITSIQAVLLDAERKHNDSAAVKNWTRRVRDVLFDAEDLIDVVATHDLLKQQRRKEKKHLKPVRDLLSKHKPFVCKDFIAEKIKTIREDLLRIYQDMAQLGLIVRCESENMSISGVRRGGETGSFVNSEDIIGRDDEKKRVVDFVYDEAYADRNVSLISIIGIGGMGKSALAQLVYNDTKISDGFKRRYWACISDIFDEKEVLGKINQSMTGQRKYQNLSLDQLQSSIRESLRSNGRFLLVLDDLWDEDASRGSKLWSILSSDHAKGSKIIITTRNLSITRAMGADKVLELQGLSRDASWALFRRYAYTKDQENDPTWIRIGEKILSKCSNVPLAIKSIASLLRVKNTIGEWMSLENEQLSKIQISDNRIMATLRLSYDHLPSHLKNCFAYCSLLPKNLWLSKKDLIYLWIAQGYIMPKEGETLQMTGNACFMDLFRRSFFQEAKYDDKMEIKWCKMHDLVHDLADDVAGEESCIITTQGKGRSLGKIRHLRVDYDYEPSNIDNPLLLLDADRIRSYVYNSYSCGPQILDENFTKFRFLRVLMFWSRGVKEVPISIGKMKYLRLLDLSNHGELTHLPDSITKLVNLITLDINNCSQLVELPRDIGELISLRHLINFECNMLRCMPPTLGELTSLQNLSTFKVTRNDVVHDGEFCELDALGRLNLRGSLAILFDDDVEWSRDDVLFESGHVLDSLEELEVVYYPSMRMAAWWTDINPASSMFPKLEILFIHSSPHVKHLPPLWCLPCLRSLHLSGLSSLEFIEDDEIVPTTPFFPSLCRLDIVYMENLKGWSRGKNAILSATPNALIFPCLLYLFIRDCPLLTSVPIGHCVENIVIRKCFGLSNFSGEGLTCLRSLTISGCHSLRKVTVTPNTVEEFTICRCPKMKLWEESPGNKMSVVWPSFGNLRVLTLDTSQKESTRLPDCLQQLVLLEKLRVKYQWC